MAHIGHPTVVDGKYTAQSLDVDERSQLQRSLSAPDPRAM